MSNTLEYSKKLIQAIQDQRYDRAEDAFNAIFADKAAGRLEQERVAVAKDFLGKKFN